MEVKQTTKHQKQIAKKNKIESFACLFGWAFVGCRTNLEHRKTFEYLENIFGSSSLHDDFASITSQGFLFYFPSFADDGDDRAESAMNVRRLSVFLRQTEEKPKLCQQIDSIAHICDPNFRD